jgi:hypothetical protein
MVNMPTQDNPYNLTEDQAVDIGEQAFNEHVGHVEGCYIGKPLVRAYLCGCLAVITHWLIKNSGGKQAFEILTEMADIAIKSDLPEGD